jgi:hypothetical protein
VEGINQPMRQWLIKSLLALLLIPAGDVAYACRTMPDGVSSRCCCAEDGLGGCDGGGRCNGHLVGYQIGCCEVSSQSDQVLAAPLGKAPVDDTSCKSSSPHEPVSLHRIAQIIYGHSPEYAVVTLAGCGQALYLTTKRLRN